VGGDALVAENLHRALLVLGLAVLVLALARRLLPAAPALLVACWWAVLPINFDALYEVHLFAPPFLLGAVLLLTGEPGPWRRGWAAALLLLAAFLVRNEIFFVVAILAAALLLTRRGRRHSLVATAVPLLVVLVVVAGAYSRGEVKGGALRESLEGRQKLTLCQFYALNYEQRHPDRFTRNPFLECRPLMRQVFGQEHPSYARAWKENPKAMAAYAAWHARLVPGGLQLGLFDAAAGHRNPDFVAAKLGRSYAAVLSVLLLVLLAAGGRVLWLDRAAWAATLRTNCLAWLALGAVVAGTLITSTFFVRPRPSYIFGLSAAVMLAAGLALAALARRYRLERAVGLAAVAAPVLLLALLPVRYPSASTPLADAYHRLEPVSGRIARDEPFAMAKVAFGDDICFYRVPDRPCKPLDYAALVQPLVASRGVEGALAARGATVFYADAAVAAQPAVARFIARPGRRWRVVNSGRDWAVLARR
jgi:hypothetical protein